MHVLGRKFWIFDKKMFFFASLWSLHPFLGVSDWRGAFFFGPSNFWYESLPAFLEMSMPHWNFCCPSSVRPSGRALEGLFFRRDSWVVRFLPKKTQVCQKDASLRPQKLERWRAFFSGEIRGRFDSISGGAPVRHD